MTDDSCNSYRRRQNLVSILRSIAFIVSVETVQFEPKSIIKMDRRQIFFDYSDILIPAEKTLTIEKYSTVFTSRDNDVVTETREELANLALNATRDIEAKGMKSLVQRPCQGLGRTGLVAHADHD